MTEQARKYLVDIHQSINLIEVFVKAIKTFDDYVKDDKTKSAVEIQLGIIGEALNRFSKLKDFEIKNATQITSLRNRIIHAYDNLDDAIIWAVAIRHLKPLKSEIIDLTNN